MKLLVLLNSQNLVELELHEGGRSSEQVLDDFIQRRREFQQDWLPSTSPLTFIRYDSVVEVNVIP